MGGKEGFGPQPSLIRAVLQHRPGDGHAVVGGGAPSDLVQDEQGAGGGVFQHLGHLRHLHHKGGLARAQVVGRPDAGEHPVHHPDPGGPGRDKGAHLRHEHNQGHLAHIGGFARHVGACDDGQAVRAPIHIGVVGDKQRVLQHPLHHRMAALPDVDGAAAVHRRADVAVRHRRRREGGQHVQAGHPPGHVLHLPHPLGGRLPQLAEQLVLQGGDPALGG